MNIIFYRISLKSYLITILISCIFSLTAKSQCFVGKYLDIQYDMYKAKDSILVYKMSDTIKYNEWLMLLSSNKEIKFVYKRTPNTKSFCDVGDNSLEYGAWVLENNILTLEQKSVSRHDSKDWTKISYKILICENHVLEMKEFKVHFRRKIRYHEEWNDFNYSDF